MHSLEKPSELLQNKEGLFHTGKARIECLLYMHSVQLSKALCPSCPGAQEETEATGFGHYPVAGDSQLSFWACNSQDPVFWKEGMDLLY